MCGKVRNIQKWEDVLLNILFLSLAGHPFKTYLSETHQLRVQSVADATSTKYKFQSFEFVKDDKASKVNAAKKKANTKQ